MTTLITDGGRYEISKKVADLLRSLLDMKYPKRLLTSSEAYSSNNMSLNHTINTRIELNKDMVL